MRNVHLITKEQEGADVLHQYLYIISDDEIKMDDWYLDDTNSVRQAITECESYWTHRKKYQKIILTTDQDLIKDGVQPIDNEFLEWFVKNPSCESIKVVHKFDEDWSEESGAFEISYYKIIIPKEEPKQYPIGGYAPGYYSCTCVTCKTEFMGDKLAVQCEPCAIEMVSVKIVENNGGCQIEEPKQIKCYCGHTTYCDCEPLQEALEEASLRIGLMEIELNHTKTLLASCEKALENRDNQAQRMYSEKEVYHILCEHTAFLFTGGKSTLSIWFEQFKKKQNEKDFN